MANSPESFRRPSFWEAVARYRKRVAVIVGSCIVIFVALAYVLPQNFESVATALPPERNASGGMISALLSNSIAADFLKGTENPTLELFKTIVESRNVAEEVAKDPKIRKFCARHDSSSDAMVGRLQNSVQGEALRTGMFTVTVDLKTGASPSSEEADETRKMSAYVANRFVEELDRFNRERLMTSAHATRVFVEKEYNARLAQLDSAYRRLQAFQEENQAIALPEQLAATVTAAAKLVGDIQLLETQISVEEHDLNPKSDRIQLLRAQLDAAKQQLQKYDDGGAGQYVIALKEVPQLTREFAGYMREAKVLEQVTAYLRQQVEQERISEQRDLPSLQMLDTAKAPLERSSPKRSLLAIIGLIIGVLGAFTHIRIRMVADGIKAHPEQHYRIIRFLDVIRGRQPVAAGTPESPLLHEQPQKV
jgi:tyrosine-protein kinase Etk/Wzc